MTARPSNGGSESVDADAIAADLSPLQRVGDLASDEYDPDETDRDAEDGRMVVIEVLDPDDPEDAERGARANEHAIYTEPSGADVTVADYNEQQGNAFDPEAPIVRAAYLADIHDTLGSPYQDSTLRYHIANDDLGSSGLGITVYSFPADRIDPEPASAGPSNGVFWQ